jgi:hypothetical protein
MPRRIAAFCYDRAIRLNVRATLAFNDAMLARGVPDASIIVLYIGNGYEHIADRALHLPFRWHHGGSMKDR